MDRRQFLTWSVAGAFLLGLERSAQAAGRALTPWIRIAPDGRVTLISTVSDMGQGSRTGQAQILSDELDAPWEMVSVEMASDSPPFQDQDGELFSGGSQSIRTRYEILRRAAATARAQLTDAAAKRWGVAGADCAADAGFIVHSNSGRRLAYGELAEAAASCAVPAQPPLKSAGQRRHVGRPMHDLDQVAKCEGRATYGLDVRLPGLRHAAIRQCPAFGGTLAAVDPAPALAAGAAQVVRLKDAVAVVAPSTWKAFKAVRALSPSWNAPPLRSDSAGIAKALAAGERAPDAILRDRAAGIAGQAAVRAAIAAAARQVEATYELPYIAHATLEPMNATAWVQPDRVRIWAPTQVQTATRKDVAAALGRPVGQVELTTTFLGGGFGRRLKTDYAVQAALIAREVAGPVQLVWSREEDLGHDFYRPAARISFRAGLNAAGAIAAAESFGATTDDTAMGGGLPGPYDLATTAAAQKQVATGVPIGAWRSVDACITVFALESFIDECAAAAGADPLAFRRTMLDRNPRARRVLDAAAEEIGWRRPRAKGVGTGLAVFQGWGTCVAHAVEVETDGERLTVRRIVAAGDPGLVINPQQVRAQWEGGALQALSAALGEAVTFTGGAADQKNFDSYQLLRMRQAPAVKVLLFETPEAPIGGVGEPGTPGVAAALANAVFAANGRRVRTLPFAAQGFHI